MSKVLEAHGEADDRPVQDDVDAVVIRAARPDIEGGARQALTDMLLEQLQRGAGGLRRGQGIDHDPSRLAADERDVGEVEATYLVDAGVTS